MPVHIKSTNMPFFLPTLNGSPPFALRFSIYHKMASKFITDVTSMREEHVPSLERSLMASSVCSLTSPGKLTLCEITSGMVAAMSIKNSITLAVSNDFMLCFIYEYIHVTRSFLNISVNKST